MKTTGVRPITNVVMMGMGEPLLNLNNVVPAMEIMLDDFGFGLSKRRVTLSTSGVVPALDKLGDMIDVALAISLHAPNDTIRDEIVPINKNTTSRPSSTRCVVIFRSPTPTRPGDHRVRHAGSRQRRYRACPRAGGAAERHPVQDQPDPMEPLPGRLTAVAPTAASTVSPRS